MSHSNSVPPQAPRRIVTAHDAEGKSVQGNDTIVASEAGTLARENEIRTGMYWATVDGLPTNDNNTLEDGGERSVGLIQNGATNFRYTDLAPGARTVMHRTPSIDYNILIQGELIHITDDGTEKHLKNPGDALIQRSTLHAWRNPTNEWARWATVLVDAKPAVVNGEEKGPLTLTN
ncbi:hypothetical protein BDN67DRAFT_1006800 [Paxillus ammoniavirescens]|nr:hypothetical protein BDN67DRAFT_1006800 [Paxillus ammoniavirescens]